jgi:hypothetical protein
MATATTTKASPIINEDEIACNGVDLFMNNDWVECEKLFNEYK